MMGDYRKSVCKGIWLHDFELVGEFNGAIEERCKRCGKQFVALIINGKTSNMHYLDHHIRNALPKYHPLFKHEFPYART